MVILKENVFLFKVALNMYKGQEKKVYREMALKGTSSLYEFAEAITDAFNFNMDHAFGFYTDEDDTFEYGHNVVYTLFYDIESLVNEPNERSVKETYIHELFEADKEMIFIYDYGVEWKFLVECCAIIEAEAGEKYPKVTKKVGKAPPQYYYSDDEEYHTDDESS